MGKAALWLLIASVLIAYYVYTPIPENIEERWKLMLINAVFKTLGHAAFPTVPLFWNGDSNGGQCSLQGMIRIPGKADIAEKLGLRHHMEIMMLISSMQYTAPVSDEKVIVTDTKMNDIPVRLYIPKEKPDSLKRAVIYIHGGGWCLGGTAMEAYDLQSRWISERLNAVIVSVEYRLAPKYHFPVQFEDVYTVTKYFLQRSVLEQYKVDPSRVCISGDSAGGNLAAAVTQQLLDDPDVKVKLKIQMLIYPALQTIDLNLPSYQDNENMPILPKSLMLRFWSEYFTTDLSLMEAMEINQHVPPEFSHLFKFVNWSDWLPERFKKNHVYTIPTPGNPKLGQKYPGFLDPRAAPLLVEDIKLRGLPLTYVITCQYDVLRDDGIMYVSRLRKAGVPVIHEHLEDAFHGLLMFILSPFSLTRAQMAVNNYIEWLNKNL